MATNIRRVDYFHTTVRDEPGEAHQLLTLLAELGVNMLAFTAVPIGPTSTQLTLFPSDTMNLLDAAQKSALILDGPHPALLVQGDDQMGALADIHAKLAEANVNVYASSGVTDGHGAYGYLVYVRPREIDRAMTALGI